MRSCEGTRRWLRGPAVWPTVMDLWPYLRAGCEGEEVPEPLNSLSQQAVSMQAWPLRESGRWLALAIGQEDKELPLQRAQAVLESADLFTGGPATTQPAGPADLVGERLSPLPLMQRRVEPFVTPALQQIPPRIGGPVTMASYVARGGRVMTGTDTPGPDFVPDGSAATKAGTQPARRFACTDAPRGRQTRARL